MEQSPKNVTVLDGKDATIICRAAGAPNPNITWIFNGKSFDGSQWNGFVSEWKYDLRYGFRFNAS